ncbi:MAG TPA: high-affinity nickel-transport family protein [Terriglobales bacterium]|jgi:high-affinity nickel-transport protein
MISLLSIIAVGFFLGMRHATDADHVIAVTTIVSRQRSLLRAAMVGAFWGLGHTLTIFVVGAGIILFNLVIPARIGLSMELSVAVMLVVLGVMNVAAFLREVPVTPDAEKVFHTHAHSHGDYIHTHAHAHGRVAHPGSADHTPVAKVDRVLGRLRGYAYVRPLFIGIVHGLAGSAAVALLVLTTIRNSRWAIAYLLVFGVGTIAGMMVITMSIATTFHFVGNRFRELPRRLAMASGLLSLAFGLVVAYQILVVHGLLATTPHWTPK